MSIYASSPMSEGAVLLEPYNSLGRRLLRIALCVVSKNARVALRWNQPSLQVSSTPYPLGSAPTVVYRRKPQRYDGSIRVAETLAHEVVTRRVHAGDSMRSPSTVLALR